MSNKPYKEINAISPENVEAIRRKTAHSMPDAPSAAGMKPDQIRRLFWEAIAGDKLSLMAELQRVIGEVNGALGDVAHFMDGTGEGQSIADVIQTGLLASYTLTQLFAGLKDGTALPLISSGVAGYNMAAYLAKLQREINLKAKQGDKGDPGDAAGFGEITVETVTEAPDQAAAVEVVADGEDVAKNFRFVFRIPQGKPGERGLQGPQGIQGVQGIQGPQGKPFAVAEIYASEEEMHADVENEEIAVGDFVMITTDSVEQAENARIYVKTDTGYAFVTDMSGATGIQGPRGLQGIPGETPHIGENGNWWVGNIDMGVSASVAVTPEFDLVMLGLEAVPTDGTVVQLEMDTTDIREALGKGAIKVRVSITDEGVVSYGTAILNNIYLSGGAHFCSCPLVAGVMQMTFNLVVWGDRIEASFTDLSGAGGGSGGVSSWDDLTDKPFGESEPVVTEILPTAPITFTFNPEVEPFYIHDGTVPIETLYMWDGEWSSATVVWDGVEYVCEPKEIYGMKVCGNLDYYLGSGDSGEPFLMIMGEGQADSAMIILCDLKTAPEDATVVSTVERSVGASLNVVEIKTLDPKFIGSVEWDKISGRPFGTVPSGTVLFDDALALNATETDDEGNTVYVYIGFPPDSFVPPDGTTIMLEYGGGEYGGIMNDGVVEVTINDKAFRFGWNFGVFMVETYISEPPDIVVSLGSDAIVKLPEEYLPDGIGGGGVEEKPVSVDMSGLDTNGTIVETYADGTTKTTTIEYDANGNPTKITDGDGNVTTLTW